VAAATSRRAAKLVVVEADMMMEELKNGIKVLFGGWMDILLLVVER